MILLSAKKKPFFFVKHPNNQKGYKFKMEIESNNVFLFLDVLVIR